MSMTVSRGRGGGVVMLRRMRGWQHGAVHVVRHLEDRANSERHIEKWDPEKQIKNEALF